MVDLDESPSGAVGQRGDPVEGDDRSGEKGGFERGRTAGGQDDVRRGHGLVTVPVEDGDPLDRSGPGPFQGASVQAFREDEGELKVGGRPDPGDRFREDRSVIPELAPPASRKEDDELLRGIEPVFGEEVVAAEFRPDPFEQGMADIGGGDPFGPVDRLLERKDQHHP